MFNQHCCFLFFFTSQGFPLPNAHNIGTLLVVQDQLFGLNFFLLSLGIDQNGNPLTVISLKTSFLPYGLPLEIYL